MVQPQDLESREMQLVPSNGPICYFTENEVSFTVTGSRSLRVGVYCGAWPAFAFAAEAAHLEVKWIRCLGSSFEKGCCNLSNFKVQTKIPLSPFNEIEVLSLMDRIVPEELTEYLRHSSLCIVTDFLIPIGPKGIPRSWKKSLLMLPVSHCNIGRVTLRNLTLCIYCKNKAFRSHVRNLFIPVHPRATLNTVLKSTDGSGQPLPMCSESVPAPDDFLPLRSPSDLCAEICSPCVFDKGWRKRQLNTGEMSACLDLPIGFQRKLEESKLITKFLGASVSPLKLYSVDVQHLFLFSTSEVSTRGGGGHRQC